MKNISRYFFIVICSFSCINISQAQWVEVNTSGGVSSLAVSGTNIFVAGGSIYLSTNNGTTWSKPDSGIIALGVNCITISGTNLFIGTTYNGVMLSTNNGTTWQAVNTGLPQLTAVYAIALSGANVYAGTGGAGVFLSTNNGANWNAVDSGLTNKSVFTLTVSNSNILAGGGYGIFLTTYNGKSWTRSDSGLAALIVNVLYASVQISMLDLIAVYSVRRMEAEAGVHSVLAYHNILRSLLLPHPERISLPEFMNKVSSCPPTMAQPGVR